MKKYILILILLLLCGRISCAQTTIYGETGKSYITISKDTISPIAILTTTELQNPSKQVYLNFIIDNKKVIRIKQKTKPIIDGQYTTMFFVIKKSDYKKIKNSHIKHIILFDLLKERKIYIVANEKIKL